MDNKMNSKHLSIGSKCPPLQNGLVRIYSMRFCPFAHRALLVAAAKKLPFDVVNCNLKQKPEWLFEKNPGAKVPTIEVPGKTLALYESLVVCDYMDEVYPGRTLNSKDPFQRALDRIWIENFSPVTALFYKCVYNCSSVESGKYLEELQNLFDPFEAELERRGQLFFGGSDAPGMIDYMIWPFIERLPILQQFYPSQFQFDKFLTRYPNLGKWEHAMKADPAVAEVFLAADIHYTYAVSSKAGTPNYDLLG